MQLLPGNLKLRFGTFVIVAVHTRVLNKNVEAVDEGARGGGTVRVKCGRVVDKTPLPELARVVHKRVNPRRKRSHVTEVIDEFGERAWTDGTLETKGGQDL